MRSERVRAILGVWAPMAIAVFIIVAAVNFYVNADLARSLRVTEVESWRLACSAGAFFVGGLMILSTYGRFKKTKAARDEPAPGPPEGPPT